MATTTNPISEAWLSSRQVMAEAHSLGISTAMISRLREQGILARPVGGRSRATASLQLRAVADARARTKDPTRIRHAVWWSEVPLERWESWRADQVAFLRWAGSGSV